MNGELIRGPIQWIPWVHHSGLSGLRWDALLRGSLRLSQSTQIGARNCADPKVVGGLDRAYFARVVLGQVRAPGVTSLLRNGLGDHP